MATYRAIFTREPRPPDEIALRRPAWILTIDGGVNGSPCIVAGNSIVQARKRVRLELGRLLDDQVAASGADIVEEFEILGGDDDIQALRAQRKELEASTRALEEETARVAIGLYHQGQSERDIGAMVGVSSQAIDRLLRERGVYRGRSLEPVEVVSQEPDPPHTPYGLEAFAKDSIARITAGSDPARVVKELKELRDLLGSFQQIAQACAEAAAKASPSAVHDASPAARADGSPRKRRAARSVIEGL